MRDVGVDRIEVGQVPGQRQGPATGRADLGGHAFGRRAVDVGQRDPRALACQCARDGAAEAAAGAQYQRGAPGESQIHGVCVLPVG